jgi:ribonuclease Y
MVPTIIGILIAVVIAVPVTYAVTLNYYKKVSEAKVGSAEQKAREIIDDAVKTADAQERGIA